MMTGGDGTAYMGEKKEPEMPKFGNTDNPSFKKQKVDPALNKKGGLDFTDYSKSPNTFKTFTRRGGIAGFVNRRFGVGATKFKKPFVSAKGLGKAALNITKANPKTAAAVAVGAAVLPPIISKARQIMKQRSDAKIEKDVEKYVADRQLKGGPKKVKYKGTNVVPPFRDKDGGIVKKSGESYKQYTPSRFTGSPFKASPLNKNKNIYGLKTEATLTKSQIKKRDEIADAISDKEMKDRYGDKNVKYAIATNLVKVKKEDYLPEVLDKKDVPHVKKLVKKLRDGSKTHAKQADDLEKAVNEDMSDKDFKKLNKDMHDTAKAGGGASQETQNKYALELARRRKTNKDGTVSTLTNKELKNEETAIESELVIQDWNVDDIKFTEIETVDIIKAKPLKESMSNWRDELDEDWQKENRKDKTDGLSKKAVKAYRRENPGSKLQTAVTTKPSKLKKGSKSAKRRLSFCRRMKGMKKKLTSAKTRRDPDSRINKALRRWNC